ncbi:MAG: heme exporter protein CcmD [Caulobacteraceae bacterium]|nr:heme exporter protein CcmD [Caulobacteraceae bacterium]
MLDFDASPYGAFVWPAFAITALVFAALVWNSLARARHWRRRTEMLRRAEAAEGPEPSRRDGGDRPA